MQGNELRKKKKVQLKNVKDFEKSSPRASDTGKGSYKHNASDSWDRGSIYLNRHTPSGQSRVYRVTQLRTDGVHC